MHLDFTDHSRARESLHAELLARVGEQDHLADARVNLAVASLSKMEITMLFEIVKVPPGRARSFDITGTVLSVYEAAIMGLLSKRLMKLVGMFNNGLPAYEATELGRVVAKIAASRLPRY